MKLLSLISILAFSVSALAQEGPIAQVDSWEQLKEVCQNPGRVNLQRPPGEVTATCVLNRKSWRQNERLDQISFPGTEQLNFEGSTDKTTGLQLSQVVDLPQEVLECPRAEQVEEIYTLSFSSSCQEIVNFEGDFGAFCRQKMSADTEALEDFKVEENIMPNSEMSLCNVEGAVESEEDGPGQEDDTVESEEDTPEQGKGEEAV